MGSETLVRVCSPYFVAGFILRDGVVKDAAPILQRPLLGLDRMKAWRIIKRNGWTAEIAAALSSAGEEGK